MYHPEVKKDEHITDFVRQRREIRRSRDRQRIEYLQKVSERRRIQAAQRRLHKLKKILGRRISKKLREEVFEAQR